MDIFSKYNRSVSSMYIFNGTFKFLNEIRFEQFTTEEEAMTNYSKPLIANSIAWWVNNVSDRYVIVFSVV